MGIQDQDTIQDQAAAADQDVTREDTILAQEQDTIRAALGQDVITRVDTIPDLDTILDLDSILGLDTTQDLVVQEEDVVILDLDTTLDPDTTLGPDTILVLDSTMGERLWEEFLVGLLDRVDPVTQDSQTRPAAESTLAINDRSSSFSCYRLTIYRESHIINDQSK